MIAMPPEEIEEAINKVNKIEEKTYEYLEFRSGKRNEKIFNWKSYKRTLISRKILNSISKD